MSAGRKESIDDDLPLARGLEPFLGDPARQRFTRGVGRGSGLALSTAGARAGETVRHVGSSTEIDSQYRYAAGLSRGGEGSARSAAGAKRLAPLALRLGALPSRRGIRPEQPHEGGVR